MASDLKKVGLVFKADGSTDFMNTLKSVNGALLENYADFKLAQSMYDKNTSTAQKLTDRLNYLNNTYDLQKDKVVLLREEIEQMSNAENKNEAAISRKKAELASTEAKLNNYEKSINKVTKELNSGTLGMKDFANKLESTGSKLTDAGKKASVLSAAIVGVGVAAKKSFDEVDEGADNVIKATGATGTAAEELKDSFENVAQSVVGDFSDIGSGLGEVNTRFGFTGKRLEDCTEQFMKFAEVNNTDVTTAVQLVSRAMGDASIDSSEYGTVLDALTKAAQTSGISIDKLTENITKYGAPMRALGFDTKESIAIFASWEKAGVNTEIAFSGMKKAISNFSKEGKDARVEFKNTLDEIAACPDIASATTKAIEVFGTKAGPDLADAIKNGRFEYSQMLELIQSSKGTVDNTFDGIVDGSYDADLAIQNAKLSMSGLGETLMTTLAPFFEKAAKVLQNFANWFDNLDSGTKNIIVTIGLLVATIGPVLLILGTLAGSVSKIILLFTQLGPVFNIVKTGISGVSAAMSFLAANPIILIIAAITTLVAVLIHLWNTNEKFRNSIINAWSYIQNLFMQFDQFLTGIFQTDWTNSFGSFGEVLNMFFANISNFYNSIKQIFQGIIDFIKGVFTGNWQLAWEGIKNIFGGIFNGLLAIAKVPLNGIIGFLNMLINGINVLIKGLNKIKVKIPDWVPSIGGKNFGLNIGLLGKIPYMADGGTLLNGAAIVAEAGPELLLQQGTKTKVVPLGKNSSNSDLNSLEDNNMIFNPTININSYSKYISPADAARESRHEMQKMLLKWKKVGKA